MRGVIIRVGDMVRIRIPEEDKIFAGPACRYDGEVCKVIEKRYDPNGSQLVLSGCWSPAGRLYTYLQTWVEKEKI